MTEETGQGIHQELQDLREQFRQFRNWLISGVITSIIAFSGQAVVVAWKAADITSQVGENKESGDETRSLVDRINEEQLRRTSSVDRVGEIQSDLKLMNQLMLSVRDDVVRMQAKEESK